MSAPLDGLRVLDLTRLLPGGFATLMLADLGADVIKVEEPRTGDYVRWAPPMAGEFSAAHVALNRNKRSLTLDLKTAPGRDLFLRLSETADVVIESFRPGVMERLGVGYPALKERRPGLVYCAITGYGRDGPRAAVAGHDANYVGYAGLLAAMGDESGRPVLPTVQVGDLGGGAMAAVVAILAALFRRAATGEGDLCDIAMTDGAFAWTVLDAAAYAASGEWPGRGRGPLTGRFPCYRLYPASDGWITVAALEPRFWTALCAALGRADLTGDAYATGDRRDEVVADLERTFSARTRAEWMRAFEGLDVCVGPVNDIAEAFADPQLRHRGMVVDGDVEGVGPWTHVGSPIKLQAAPAGPGARRPPRLGEHNEEVLAEIGIDRPALEALRTAGVV